MLHECFLALECAGVLDHGDCGILGVLVVSLSFYCSGLQMICKHWRNDVLTICDVNGTGTPCRISLTLVQYVHRLSAHSVDGAVTDPYVLARPFSPQLVKGFLPSWMKGSS